MKRLSTARVVLLALLFFLISILSMSSALSATGNLSVLKYSDAQFSGVLPGGTVTYYIYYTWEGDGPAPNVVVTDLFSSDLEFMSAEPVPSSQTVGTITWNLGTLSDQTFGLITIQAIVKDNVPVGSKVSNTVSITGDVTDEDTEDNTATVEISIEPPAPDLWVFKWGLLETIESGFFFTTELNVPATFEVYYFNFSTVDAPNTVIEDELAEGLQFLSAEPPPTSINGSRVSWEIGTLEGYGWGMIKIIALPTQIGILQNTVTASSDIEDRDDTNNISTFNFEVVPLIQPRVLKPSLRFFGSGDTLIVGRNPRFEGLAKAGATVTLYEGSASGCFGDFSGCDPIPLGSVTVGPDRKWTLTPTTITEPRVYNLYVAGEFEGTMSAPPFGFWLPAAIRIDSLWDLAGFDMDNFVIGTDNHTVHPGGLGGRSGTTPNDDIVITMRQRAPDAITSNPELLDNHMLKLVVHEDGTQDEVDLPVSSVEKVNTNAGKVLETTTPSTHYDSYDFIYVQKGFGPGSRVEIWCLPVYYDDETGIPLVGLVYVKCHELLIDPAGYVYDLDLARSTYDWPEIPPSHSLITNATVTAYERTGDTSWVRWEAELTGQVNPQITDDSDADRINVPGYYAFYVPPGQFQVKANALNFADYTSPILTVVDEPIFHNIGMRRLSGEIVKVPHGDPAKALPEMFTLEQNYPNPFNPVTTIAYSLPTAGRITLKIYDINGKEVGTLINNEYREAGSYALQYDASSLASGMYFYRMIVGNNTSTKKFILLK